MNGWLLLALLGLALYAGTRDAAAMTATSGAITGARDALLEAWGRVNSSGEWQAPAAATPYLPLIRDTERELRLPHNLLARTLYEESRFRPDVIDGTTPSVVGALGIAQFMPDTADELGIDPLDPRQAIPAAGRYLADLFAQFGDWTLALTAYNWGMGNVRKKGISRAPSESIDYATSILNDVQVFG